MKKTVLVFILSILFSFSARMFAQGTPEKFSREFLNCFINYNEEKLKKFISSEPKEQIEMLKKLKDIYVNDLKPLKGYALSSSTRAVLKDGDEKFKEIADIFIMITDNQKIKYELNLWGCYVINGNWMLGDKVELKK